MLPERFVVDEAGFTFADESPGALEASFIAFNELLSHALEAQQGVVKHSQLWFTQSASGCDLLGHLTSAKAVDQDVRRLLLSRLDKVRSWDDEDPELAPSGDVTCGNTGLSLAPAIELCALAARGRRGVACLTTLQSGRRGPLGVTLLDGGGGTVSFLVTSDDAPDFWRRLVDLEDLDASDIAELCHLAFPRLAFVPGVWDQARRFEGSFRDVVRARLARDLSGLNDHAPEIWRNHVEPARIAAAMASHADVDCSRESPKMHKNAAAMRQRQVELDGRHVECEWHTKLERHRNRVHFAVDGARVVIGVMARHI